MVSPLIASFNGGQQGPWRIERMTTIIGQPLAAASRLDIREGVNAIRGQASTWVLRGVTSNTRYTTRPEANSLSAKQEGLVRPEATRAALIPIRKSEAWWNLAQDERRAIFEEQSRHIAIGLDYLPAVARRLYHCRELGETFDFLTWFEYAPQQETSFEELVGRLRGTGEWSYVERDIDIRLSRE